MRELFNLQGKRVSVKTTEEALTLVRKPYPKAMKQGSVGCWTFFVGKIIVAEAWLRTGKGDDWWLRIKDVDAKGPLR